MLYDGRYELQYTAFALRRAAAAAVAACDCARDATAAAAAAVATDASTPQDVDACQPKPTVCSMG